MADQVQPNTLQITGKNHPRPTIEDSSAIVGAVIRMNNEWRLHADEQEQTITILSRRIAGLERVVAEHGTWDLEPGQTLAQQAPQLQAKVTELMGKMLGLQEEVKRLETEMQAVRLETHRECDKALKAAQKELADERLNGGKHSAYQKSLRNEIILLKAKLGEQM